MKKLVGFVIAAAVSSVFADLAFDADTIAFYPFDEGADGATLTKNSASVLNAVDSTRYAGTPKQVNAYGTNIPMYYTNDVPAPYIFANGAATTAMLGPGDYRAVVFPDMAAGVDTTDNTPFPLLTNETARTAAVTYNRNSTRPSGSSTLKLAGLNTALARLSAWTVEFFLKIDSPCTTPNPVLLYGGFASAPAETKLQLLPNYGQWNVWRISGAYDATTKSAGYSFPTSWRPDRAGWQHVALVHADEITALYVNGELKTSISHRWATPVEESDSPLLLGDVRDSYPSNPFYGRIAALRVTKRALTSDEFMVGDSMPTRAAAKEISGDYVVAAEGETYRRVTITAGARITGGVLGVSEMLTLPAAAVSFENAGLRLDGVGGVTVTVPAGGTLAMDAPVTGSVAWTLIANGSAYFNAANTFTGAFTIRGAGDFHVANDSAFGSTDMATTVFSNNTDGNLKLHFDGVDISEPLEFRFQDTADQRVLFTANTANVLRGYITSSTRCNFSFASQSYTVISNDVSYMGYVNHAGSASALVDIYGKLNELRANFSAGTYRHFTRHPELTTRNYGIVLNGNGTHVMEMVNVFAASADATSAYEASILRFSSAATLDLNGYDQRFASICENGAGVIKSDTPATLALDATTPPRYTPDNTTWVDYERMNFNGSFRGAVALSVEGPLPLDLAGVSTTTGRLTVTNGGSVKFTGLGSWAGNDIRVTGAGSSITLTASDNLASTATVDLSNGGKLRVEGPTVRVGVALITTNGVPLSAAGTYGPVGSGAVYELDCLEGDGLVMIGGRTGVTCTWTADGSAGTAVSSAANWENGVKPDSILGIDAAIFTAAGATPSATIDAALVVDGITLRRPVGDGFTFAAGGGTLRIGRQGIEADEGHFDAARHYTNNVPTAIAESQVWNFPATATTFTQNGALSAYAGTLLTVTGNADVHLAGDNSAFFGDIDLAVSADASASGTVVHVWNSTALGGATGVTKIGAKNVSSGGQRTAQLVFHGTNEIDRALDFYGNDSPRFGLAEENDKVVFRKMVDIHGGIMRPITPNGCELVFAGGLNTTCYRVTPPYGGKVVITNTPSALGSFSCTSYSTLPGVIEIHTSSNTYSSGYGVDIRGAVRVDLFALDAISRTTYSGAPGGVSPKICMGMRYLDYRDLWAEIDLHGHDQHAGVLEEVNSTGTEETHARIRSDEPAQLYIMQGESRTVTSVAFEGAAGLTLEGAGTLTLTNVTSTTTGMLAIQGGNLVLWSAWPNAGKVSLASGTLACRAPQLFGKRTTSVELETGGGTLDLGGCNQTVREVVVDGVRLPTGYYTAASPELKGLVTGAGTLRVFGDGPGVKIYFR